MKPIERAGVWQRLLDKTVNAVYYYVNVSMTSVSYKEISISPSLIFRMPYTSCIWINISMQWLMANPRTPPCPHSYTKKKTIHRFIWPLAIIHHFIHKNNVCLASFIHSTCFACIQITFDAYTKIIYNTTQYMHARQGVKQYSNVVWNAP